MTAEFVIMCTNNLQTLAVKTHFRSARHVTRFTKREFVGLQQSTDVCLTTPLWPSLMTTFVHTSQGGLCCRKALGLACWGHGGRGQV